MMPSPSNLSIGGIPVVASDQLPIPPTDGEVARRIVRHGLARVLEQLGEKVGPKPEAQTHAMILSGTMFVSITASRSLAKNLATRSDA